MFFIARYDTPLLFIRQLLYATPLRSPRESLRRFDFRSPSLIAFAAYAIRFYKVCRHADVCCRQRLFAASLPIAAAD